MHAVAGFRDQPGRGVRLASLGLTANTTYHYRIVATNAGGESKGSDQTFTTLPNAPAVVTEAASSVTQTSATLNATVNPEGGNVTDCHFEYGTTNAYGSSAPCTPSPASETSPVAVSASLGILDLTANTAYHFRIVATNAGGESKGSDQTFTTLPNAPAVVTEAASSVTQTSATLNATVNPEGGNVTDCHFEYGTTNAYGSSAPCTPSPASETSPSRCPPRDHRPDRQHHLPLPDRRDQRRRRKQRLRSDVHDAAQRSGGRDRSGLLGHPDLRDAERHGQPRRRQRDRLPLRIRHQQRLRLERPVHAVAGFRDQPGRGVRLAGSPA